MPLDTDIENSAPVPALATCLVVTARILLTHARLKHFRPMPLDTRLNLASALLMLAAAGPSQATTANVTMNATACTCNFVRADFSHTRCGLLVPWLIAQPAAPRTPRRGNVGVRPAAVILAVRMSTGKFRPVPLDTWRLTPVFLVGTDCPPDVAARANNTYTITADLLKPILVHADLLLTRCALLVP
jgi:hypothetical protein